MKTFVSTASSINAGNAERSYDVIQPGSGLVIRVDNVRGIGETPDNRSVLHKGCVAEMSCRHFHILAAPTSEQDMEQRGSGILESIREHHPIASPALYLDVSGFVQGHQEDGLAIRACASARVVGHEGRARVWALRKLGFRFFPIQLLFSKYRARDIKDWKAFHTWLDMAIVGELRRTSTRESVLSLIHAGM